MTEEKVLMKSESAVRKNGESPFQVVATAYRGYPIQACMVCTLAWAWLVKELALVSHRICPYVLNRL